MEQEQVKKVVAALEQIAQQLASITRILAHLAAENSRS